MVRVRVKGKGSGVRVKMRANVRIMVVPGCVTLFPMLLVRVEPFPEHPMMHW